MGKNSATGHSGHYGKRGSARIRARIPRKTTIPPLVVDQGSTVDFQKLIYRLKNILVTPKTAWPVIAEEPATTGSIFKGYVLILAAIPAVFGLLSAVAIGTRIPFGGVIRIGFGFALSSALL